MSNQSISSSVPSVLGELFGPILNWPRLIFQARDVTTGRDVRIMGARELERARRCQRADI
jgi:hypothetical protein